MKNHYKVILVGESNSGKTCIANRISKDIFTDDQRSTIGSNQFEITQEYENQQVKYSLWDTAGQEKYRSLIPSYSRNADIILLVFDLSDPEPFSSIDRWYQILKETLVNNPIIILIGNKLDLGISVEEDKIQELCNNISDDMSKNNKHPHQVPYVQTSAKTNEGMSILVTLITKLLFEIDQGTKATTQSQQPPQTQKIQNEETHKKKCC